MYHEPTLDEILAEEELKLAVYEEERKEREDILASLIHSRTFEPAIWDALYDMLPAYPLYEE